MFNGIDKPARTYTLEDFIGFKAQDNMTYYNFSILSKSILKDGIIYSKDNVIYNYLDILKGKSKKLKLTDSEYHNYRFKPKLLAYDLYGSSELFFVIMAINGICDIKDFDMKKFRMLTPKDLNSLLSQIYSADIDYIEYNRQEVGEKNIVI